MGRVLLVDDDHDLVEAYKMAIESQGHEALACHSAAEAREQLEKDEPDLVVLDVMMETRSSGFDLAREINERYPSTPIIMLTAVHEASDPAMRFEPDSTWLPVTTFLDKPVDPGRLTREIDTLLPG
jgi:DNA-binding response OmpR family regulator